MLSCLLLTQNPRQYALAAEERRYVLKDNRMKLIATLLFLLPVLAYADTTTYSCNYTTYSDQEGPRCQDSCRVAGVE
jgi:hypothetical protein